MSQLVYACFTHFRLFSYGNILWAIAHFVFIYGPHDLYFMAEVKNGETGKFLNNIIFFFIYYHTTEAIVLNSEVVATTHNLNLRGDPRYLVHNTYKMLVSFQLGAELFFVCSSLL